MSGRLGGLLEDARRLGFVGRSSEMQAFAAALVGAGTQRVLFVHGPGGIGKTTLLGQLRRQARDAGRLVIDVDGRGSDVGTTTLQRAAADLGQRGGVILLDGYERILALDEWIRESWLPSLTDDTIVVIAGRSPPAVPWRTDPGWRALVGVHGLAPFDDDEAAELLARAGADPAAIGRLVQLGGGHPLTLSLLAAVADGDQIPASLYDAPDVVSSVLPVLIADAPSPMHHLGLQLCASVWLLTEELLRDAVGDEAADVWAWLSAQPFVSPSADGLHAHDLVRDLLEAHLEHGDPATRRQLHDLVRQHARGALHHTSRPERLRAATQLLWLHRRSTPIGQLYAEILEHGSLTIGAGLQLDHDEVVEHVARWEGDEEAGLVSAWLTACPEGLRVTRRGPHLTAHCFATSLSGEPPRPPDGLHDPVTELILAETEQHRPPRAGERIYLLRSGGGPGRQDDPDCAVIIGVTLITDLHSPRFGWAWCVISEPEVYEPTFDYMGFDHRLDIGDGRVAFGIDWSRIGFDRWYDEMIRRSQSGETGPFDPALLRAPLVDRPAFERAVREALRCLRRPSELAANPLMATVIAETPHGPEVEQLRVLLEWSIRQLADDPTTGELHRVLDRTFLGGAPTQEAAAEVLGLPFSTYRRRLTRGTERVTDLLWSLEVGQLGVDDLDLA